MGQIMEKIVGFRRGDSRITIDGHSIDCGFPVLQAYLWSQKSVVVVLEEARAARLRVYGLAGSPVLELFAPKGVLFEYLTSHEKVGISVVCAEKKPIGLGSIEYHYGINLEQKCLEKLGLAR